MAATFNATRRLLDVFESPFVPNSIYMVAFGLGTRWIRVCQNTGNTMLG
jgi:hypothetical protein